MEELSLIILIFSSILLVLLATLYLLKSKKFTQNQLETAKLIQLNQLLKEQNEKQEIDLGEIKEQNENLKNFIHNLELEEAKKDERLMALKRSYELLEESFSKREKELKQKIESIMEQSLNEKLEKFDKNSIKTLGEFLKPFEDRLESFKKEIKSTRELGIESFAKLSSEINQVSKAGLNISKEAQNLTEALKGKKQLQGSWGEMILESVLDYSGLIKGVHYETQQSYKDGKGKIKRPDVIIKLPKEKTIIIDSKVTLSNYELYVKSRLEEEKKLYAKALVSSFKAHIDSLESKEYAKFDLKTLQYVFMFVPIEGAFSLALQEDSSLYEYALRKHIAIVTPSTLTVSLRTIYLYWQSEHSTQNAQKLFIEAGKLYDKIALFVENFYKMGNQINALQNSYNSASSQLFKGQGNIASRTQSLKHLGAKTLKQLNIKKPSDDFVILDEFVEEK
ncbi:MAG: DNA recombination protein RmuC [Sulfurospirillaceae bacterium]|nr:DNA recombination protein RmuC [Sulfurospirillaceae bacterium]